MHNWTSIFICDINSSSLNFEGFSLGFPQTCQFPAMLGSDAMSAAKNNTCIVLKHKIAKFVGASQSFKEIEKD
jgi:hypothetical protein